MGDRRRQGIPLWGPRPTLMPDERSPSRQSPFGNARESAFQETAPARTPTLQ